MSDITTLFLGIGVGLAGIAIAALLWILVVVIARLHILERTIQERLDGQDERIESLEENQSNHRIL